MSEKPTVEGQLIALDRQTRVQSLDMAMRYFAGKSAKQLVENAAVFETYIKEGHRNE